MTVALDTNRLTDLFGGDAQLAGFLSRCDAVWIPLVVLGEILAGFYAGSQRRRNEGLLNELLAKPTVSVLLPDSETAEYYAQVWFQLRRNGTMIPDNDLWIAALALQHNLVLITRDSHFDPIPQLMRG